jgi:hypothetical protein
MFQRMRFTHTFAAVVLLLASTGARADTSEAPGATVPVERPRPLDDATARRVMASLSAPTSESRWYGYELVLADGLGVGSLWLLASASHEHEAGGVLATVAAGSLLLTPAFIHASHGRHGAAAASVALRLGLPLLGAVIGTSACTDSGGENWCLGPPAVGFAAGALAAVAIDDIGLSWETRPVAPRAPRVQVGFAPRADHGMTFTVAGAF